MSTESDLVATLVAAGIPESMALDKAAEWGDWIVRKSQRIKREQSINDMFLSKPRPELAKQENCHRSTIYRIRAKLSQKKLVLQHHTA